MVHDVEYKIEAAMKKKSIVDIFKKMEYEEEENEYKIHESGDSPRTSEKVVNNDASNDLLEILKIKKEPKSFESALEAAIKAQNKWKNSAALKRANSLHEVWKVLKEYYNQLSKSKNEALTLLDYFDFYSDLTIQTENYESWRPQGVVLVVLSNYSPSFVLGATVPAALASGCSVIVLAPENAKAISLFLKEVISEAGLLEGLFNVVTDFREDNIPVSKKINKVFYCGSYLSIQNYYAKNLSKSFNFFCPNNTTALILESSDLNAAVTKIVQATWGENSLFGVSTAVVQESVWENFILKLKYQMDQFMIEHKSSSKFRDVIVAEKINKIILEALNAGASVEKGCINENIWSPTALMNYQNQNIDEDVPVLKVLPCRTAKEGIALINNCRYSLGVSVWSELSSQALEISSMLVCPNIWINCHGLFQANEPLQLSTFSGDCVLGGSDGILEYMLFTAEEPSEANKTSEDKSFHIDKIKLLQIAGSAHQAFTYWKSIKSRRKIIKSIGDALKCNKELTKLSENICTYAHFCNAFNFSERNSSKEFLVVKEKLPLGVILLIVNSTHIEMTLLVSLITFPIALGNAVIILLKDENSVVKSLLEVYNKILPKNLLNIVIGIKTGTCLLSDPNIKAIWLFDETEISAEFLQTIRSHSVKSLKHIWVVPKNLSVSPYFFQKECLQIKAVWLTRIDQFP